MADMGQFVIAPRQGTWEFGQDAWRFGAEEKIHTVGLDLIGIAEPSPDGAPPYYRVQAVDQWTSDSIRKLFGREYDVSTAEEVPAA